MFYSETLLSKTGPLARVWLSANLERKLSKTHILQSNIESSVGAIVGQDQAPMALRLSGQLLLGVVRIYSRKARYLLEDCNEALLKIKMAFRPGNVDLPAGATSHSAAQLTLPDVITELDLLLPDPTFDLGDVGDLPLDSDAHVSRRQDITLDDSQFLQSSVEHPRGTRPGADGLEYEGDDGLLELEDDLGLDIGEMSAEEPRLPRAGRASTVARGRSVDFLSDLPDISIELGRDAPPDRDIGEDLFSDDRMEGLELEELPKEPGGDALGFEEDGLGLGFGEEDDLGYGGEISIGDDADLTLLGVPSDDAGGSTVGPGSVRAPPSVHAPSSVMGGGLAYSQRDSESPLSSVRSSVERELSADIHRHGALLDISYLDNALRVPSEDPEQVHAQQRQARKRKVVVDSVTEIRAKQIKAQQEDRSKILKEPSFLPRDPTLLALLSLQKTGGFAQSVFYPKNIAPELADLLSPEFVKRMAVLKRKREEEAGQEPEEGQSPVKQVRLEIEEQEDEDTIYPEIDPGAGHHSPEVPEEILEYRPEEEQAPLTMGHDDDDEFNMEHQNIQGSSSPGPAYSATHEDRTPEPEEELDLPQPTQPVSQLTRATVHLLRDQFSEPSAKKSVTFQELLPQETTTRIDATKMFFEVLVLATKDAVKITQEEGFGDIVLGGKKALWGAWAEEKDEQTIAEEKEKEAAEAKERGVVGQRTEVVVGQGRAVEEASAAA